MKYYRCCEVQFLAQKRKKMKLMNLFWHYGIGLGLFRYVLLIGQKRNFIKITALLCELLSFQIAAENKNQ